MEKITAKLLANELKVSIKSAETYLRDIKNHYKTPIVLRCHLNKYFNV